MELSRRDNESEYDYHKRLIFGKLVDKTLADADYTEIAEAVYGKPYSSDVARRMLYGSKRTIDLIDSNISTIVNEASSSSTISEIDNRINEMNKERVRLRDQRREYNKLVTSESRFENLYDAIVASADKLNETVGNVFSGQMFAEESSNFDKEAVIVFSDWHYGMVVDNIYNKYNTSVFASRVNTAVKNIIQRIKDNNCHDATIVILGDLIHGAIHTSARVASEELVCDQLMKVSEILAQAIQHISAHVGSVKVYTTYGNHARTVQDKQDSIHRDNMERIVRWWLEERFKNDEGVFIMPEQEHEFICFNVLGHDICAAHGDLDLIKSSPRLLYSLMGKKKGLDIEYIILGDKHHYERFDELGMTSVICGSLCGSDSYANDKRLYSDPSQLMFIVDRKYGVDAEYKIKCE